MVASSASPTGSAGVTLKDVTAPDVVGVNVEIAWFWTYAGGDLYDACGAELSVAPPPPPPHAASEITTKVNAAVNNLVAQDFIEFPVYFIACRGDDLTNVNI